MLPMGVRPTPVKSACKRPQRRDGTLDWTFHWTCRASSDARPFQALTTASFSSCDQRRRGSLLMISTSPPPTTSLETLSLD